MDSSGHPDTVPVVHARGDHATSRLASSECGTTTFSATWGRAGTSQRKSNVAANAPASCATMKPGASTGRIPANVSLAARARVTAGFANDVDEVNQYAAVM